jgi:hypothetical protein
MLERESLTELIAEIVSQGYDEQTASRFAVLLGDTPATDDSGNVIVLDDGGAVLATLKPLKFFSDK